MGHFLFAYIKAMFSTLTTAAPVGENLSPAAS